MNDATSSLPSPNPMPDLSGRTLGNYRLIHRLGRGGMADVYLAEQPSLQRQVAVKVLRQDLAEKSDYVRRFHNEAKAAAALVHANIVQIYEVGRDEGIHFIAQEYVPGQNVKQLVTRQGPLPVDRVVSILRQMGAALQKASQGKIVHRDIKPENILLAPGGEVKVADFGLARVVDPQNVDLTQAGVTMGTPLYMSPEQVEGQTLDHRSDLYSCGVTGFYMLAGRPPFEGDTPLSVAVQHLQNEPPNLAELRPDAPAELTAIIARLLQKKLADRYSSAAQLLQDLRAIPLEGSHPSLPTETEPLDGATGTGIDATRQLQHIMTAGSTTNRPARTWTRWVSLFVAAIVLGGVLAWLNPTTMLSPSAQETSGVDRLETAEDQYWEAMRLNTVEAWRSVAQYHPPAEGGANRHYAHRALQHLGWLYLQNDQLDLAMETYSQLAELPPQEREFRTLGQAGQAVVLHRRGDLNAARTVAAEPLRNLSQLHPQSPLRQELARIAEEF